LRQDVTFGVRTLRRNALLTTLVVGGLALGIARTRRSFAHRRGARSQAARPQPGSARHCGRPDLCRFARPRTPDGKLFSYPLWLDVRNNAQAFDAIAAVGDPIAWTLV
jgi:hypothetical protein